MSSRNNFGPKKVITAGDMSANITGEPTIMQFMTKLGYQFVWTGTAIVGDVTIEVSNNYSLDAAGNVKDPGNWVAMPFSDSTGATVVSVPLSGAAGNFFIDVSTSSAYAIRPVFTATSGVGVLNCVAVGKVA
jgi:hypothetical protein